MIESAGRSPIVLDLGTGLRFFGLTRPVDEPFKGTALVSHLHWDHIQGIPFFTPLLREGSSMDLFGPPQEGSTLEDAVRSFIQPPYFPVTIDELPGKVVFHEILDDVIDVEGAKVTVAAVPHCGLTLGFRVECDNAAVAYISDHQQPGIDSTFVDPAVLRLCHDVDVLVHDSQFNRDDFAAKSDWGHCTVDYAAEVAAQSGAETLVLFHHDPSRSDDEVKEFRQLAESICVPRGVGEVVAAAEGLTLSPGCQSPD